MNQQERDWILTKAASVNGICTFHLNDDFAKYCDLFSKGYDNFPSGQIRLRKMCGLLEREGLLWSEWGGTGRGGGMDFGTKLYKTWYSINNKWNHK
jgi:hypothetical protein